MVLELIISIPLIGQLLSIQNSYWLKLRQKTTFIRTSKQTWLEDVDDLNMTSKGYYALREDINIHDATALNIADRISLATRLYTSSKSGGEAFQVMNDM